jgi:hypothetical protein
MQIVCQVQRIPIMLYLIRIPDPLENCPEMSTAAWPIKNREAAPKNEMLGPGQHAPSHPQTSEGQTDLSDRL